MSAALKGSLRLICALLLLMGMTSHLQAQERKRLAPKREPATACSAGSSSVIAKFKTVKGEALPESIPEPLTKKAGDPERGLETIIAEDKGNCLSCHFVAKVAFKAKQSDPDSVKRYDNHGEIGPPLNGVGARYTVGELRMLVVDIRRAFPDTVNVMPAYHARPDSKDVIRACRGRAILSAQAIEDVIAYLAELK